MKKNWNKWAISKPKLVMPKSVKDAYIRLELANSPQLDSEYKRALEAGIKKP